MGSAWYTADGLALLTGRTHRYTQAFLSQVASADGAERFTDALACWTTHLWNAPAEEMGESDHYLHALTCYVDGHRKPVYSEVLIPRGLIGRLRVILGYRALLLLHDEHGHPLFVITHRGDQHLTVGVPAFLARYEQHAEHCQVTRMIVDREGMATEFAKSFAPAPHWETLLSLLSGASTKLTNGSWDGHPKGTTRAVPPPAPPNERMTMGIPIGSRFGDRITDLFSRLEAPPFEGQGTQRLPPGLDQIQVRCIGWLKDEFPAWVSHAEQQDIRRPMYRQAGQDGVNAFYRGGNPLLDLAARRSIHLEGSAFGAYYRRLVERGLKKG